MRRASHAASQALGLCIAIGALAPRSAAVGSSKATPPEPPAQETTREAKLETTIKAYQRLSDAIRTGAQPSAEELAWLKADGVKTVLNLREPSEYDSEAERAQVEALELGYINIPVSGASPSDAQADEFRKTLAAEELGPLFIHCASANRVGAFWLIHRVLDAGLSIPEAEREAERVGLKSPVLKQFALDYIQRHGAAPAKP